MDVSGEDIAVVILGLIVLILFIRALFKGSVVLKYFGQIVDDTLKKDGKWSKMSIITATAWAIVIWSFHYDLINNGFNETAWFGLLAVATGNKVMDAWSKKVDPTIVTPKDVPVTDLPA